MLKGFLPVGVPSFQPGLVKRLPAPLNGAGTCQQTSRCICVAVLLGSLGSMRFNRTCVHTLPSPPSSVGVGPRSFWAPRPCLTHENAKNAPELARLQAFPRKGMCMVAVGPPWHGPGSCWRSPQGCKHPDPQARPEQTRISLVSGFGPFRQHLVNPSWEAVKVNPARPRPRSPGLAACSGAPETQRAGLWSWGCCSPIPRWPSGWLEKERG